MKRSLALLGLAGLLPIIVLSAAYAISSLYNERDALARRAELRSQFSAMLISRELASQMRSIRMVSQSPAFDRAIDIDRFKMLAARLVQDEPSWRVLSIGTPDGIRVADVPEPIGGLVGGRVIDPKSFNETIRTRRTAVGDIVRGPRGALAFAVRAPVVRRDRVIYVVSAVVPAAAMQRLVLGRNLPEGWRIAIRDGLNREVTSDGAPLDPQALVFSSQVAGTRWAVRVEVPARQFSRLTRQSELVVVGGAISALVLFAILVWLLLRELRALREREASTLHAHRLEALGRLTGGVAHDLNNLLTPILGGLEMLRRSGAHDEKTLRYIDNATLSAERAAKLVARLLTFSRRQSFVREAIDVGPFLVGLEDLLLQSLGNEYKLTFAISPGTQPILTDRDTFELTIMNLVINARDAMAKGGEVRIEARDAAAAETVGLDAGSYVAVSIVDQGHGMDEATLRRAREPFFSTKAPGEGTGLGLSMAHGFCEQSGGTLLLRSDPGLGTTVTLILPTVQDPTR